MPSITEKQFRCHIQTALRRAKLSLKTRVSDPIMLVVSRREEAKIFVGKADTYAKYWCCEDKWRYGDYFLVNITNTLEISDMSLTKIAKRLTEDSTVILNNWHSYPDNKDDHDDYLIKLENGWLEGYSQL